jgi:hypothetical protein
MNTLSRINSLLKNNNLFVLKVLASTILLLFIFPGENAFSAPKNNFFAFSNPQQGYDTSTKDPDVFYKMQYYGYFTGAQPTSYISWYGIEPNLGLFRNATNATEFWTAVDKSLSDYASFVQAHWNYFPPVNKMQTSNRKILMPWNCDLIFDKFADSLICFPQATTQADTFAFAIKAISKFVIKSDSLFRQHYYPNCDTIIHQVAEEINYHYHELGTMYNSRHNWLVMFAKGDTTKAYRMWFGVMDSIAATIKRNTPSKTLTAVDWHYFRETFDIWPDNNTAFRSAAFDSLTNINIFFLVTDGRRPEYHFIDMNNAANSLGNRKLGIRYSWFDNSYDYSFAQQIKTLQDINRLVPNAQYLSLYTASVLDGRTGSADVDATTHFKALAYWLGKKYIHLMDHFCFNTTDPSYLWNKSGTLAYSSSDSSLSISQNSYIRSKTLIDGGGTAYSYHKRGNEYSGGKKHSTILHVSDDENKYISLFTRNDSLIAEVRQSALTRTYPITGVTVNGNEHEYKIYWDSGQAKFYFDGQYKTTIDSLAGDFDTSIKLKLSTADFAGISNLVVDSTWVLANDTIFPNIEITNFGVDTIYVGGLHYARPWIAFECEAAADVEFWLQYTGNAWPYGDVQTEWLSQTLESTTGDSLWWWMHAYSTGWYRLKLIATKDGKADSTWSNQWHWDSSTGTILAGVEEIVILNSGNIPKAFSLHQNYPNPFNPSTSICYSIPSESKPLEVNLELFNLRGQLITSLVKAQKQLPGTYVVNWDGKGPDGRPVSSGVYFYRLRVGEYVATRKMVLVK